MRAWDAGREFPLQELKQLIILHLCRLSDAQVLEPSTGRTGVREAPRHEIAEKGAGRLSAA